MKQIVMSATFLCLNINAMNVKSCIKDYYSPGKHVDISNLDNFNLAPCKQEDIEKDRMLVIKQSENDWVWGHVASVIAGQYYIKDTARSGKEYKLSQLYKLEPKLNSEK